MDPTVAQPEPALRSTEHDYLTKPIVKAWTGFITRAKAARQEFDQVAEQCRSFYAKASTFMWDPKYLEKYIGNSIQQPKFQITFNKAYEYVTIFTPMLFWEYASRKAAPYDSLKLDAETIGSILGITTGDPNAAGFVETMAASQSEADQRNAVRARIMQHYLNYSQREQPGGGLTAASTMAIGDALLTGRGCLWTQAYAFPGSDRTLTGNFWVSVDDILIDPDCLDISLMDARWIGRRHVNHYWQVEEMFGLPTGSLKSTSDLHSNNAQPAVAAKDVAGMARNKDQKGDLIEWWEIYSKAGCGNKLGGTHRTIDPFFDEELGDNVFLCIAPGVPYPLNVPSQNFDLLTVGDLTEATRWPTELWRDLKWPLRDLWFAARSGNNPWPLSPLAPALGEMTALNIMVAAYVQQCYESRQAIIAYLEGSVEEIDKVISSEKSPLAIPIKADIQKSIKDLITFLNRPEINGDLLRGIEFLLQRIAEITGLNELLYGSNPGGAVSRSAADAQAKQSNTSIRPDYMSKRVAEWQTEAADAEKIVAYYHVKASDISDLLGPAGMEAWRVLIEEEEPEAVLRNMHCFIEASEIKKPDRARDFSNLQQITQTVIPVLAAHATQTGDYEPLNAFMDQLGQAMEMDLSGFSIPSQPSPEPDPEIAEINKQHLQAQVGELNAKIEKLLADAAAARAQAEITDPETQLAMRHQEMSIKQAEAESKLDVRQSELEMKAAASEHAMEMAQQKNELQLAAQAETERIKQAGAEASHLQSLDHADELHQQALDTGDDRAAQQIQHANMIGFQKMIAAGQMNAIKQANAQNPQLGSNT